MVTRAAVTDYESISSQQLRRVLDHPLVLLMVAGISRRVGVVGDQPILRIQFENLHLLFERERQHVNQRTDFTAAVRFGGMPGLQNERNFPAMLAKDAAPVGHAGAPGRIVAWIL